MEDKSIMAYLDELSSSVDELQMWFKVAFPRLPVSNETDVLRSLTSNSETRGEEVQPKESTDSCKPILDIRPIFVSKMKILSDISGIHYSPRYPLGDTIEGVLPYRNFYKAIRFLIAYLEVLFDSYDSAIRLDLSYLSALKVMQSWPDHLFEKSAKYCTAYPMAYLIRRTETLSGLPPTPDHMKEGLRGAIPFEGKPLRYLSSRLRTRIDSRLVSFCWGVLQGVKRATETVSSIFVLDTMLKHRKAMKKVPKLDEKDLDDFSDYLDRIPFGRISRKVRLLEVSNSASYETSRKDGGAREEVRTLFKDIDHLEKMNKLPRDSEARVFRSSHLIPPIPELVRYTYNSCLKKKEKLQHGAIQFSSLSRAMPQATLNARVAAVLEPLKCRLITAGEALPYYLSRSYQKDLWGSLKKFDIFSATNRPIDLGDFENLLLKEKFLGLKWDFWVSGDYSAATDNLNMNYSKETFEHLLRLSSFENLDFFDEYAYKQILRSVLYGHRITYPVDHEYLDKVLYMQFCSYWPARISREDFERYHKDKLRTYVELGILPDSFDPILSIIRDSSTLLTSVNQTNGQLMGSTLSFPVLCIVNAVCYWRSLEKYLGRKVAFQVLPLLVNGDDILFRSNKEHYSIWCEEITRAGFELSVGKNYVSPTFFSINSKGFRYVNGEIKPVKGFNVGLLMGQSKGNNDRSGNFIEASHKGIDSLYNGMIETATNPLRATRRFLHYNREHIDRLTMKGLYNLFLPKILGGVGLNPPIGLKMEFTDVQRGLALKCLKVLKATRNSPKFVTPVRVISELDTPSYIRLKDRPIHEWFLSEWVDHPAIVQDTEEDLSLAETMSFSTPQAENGKSSRMVSDVILSSTRDELRAAGLADRILKKESGNSLFPSLGERNRLARCRWVRLDDWVIEGYQMLDILRKRIDPDEKVINPIDEAIETDMIRQLAVAHTIPNPEVYVVNHEFLDLNSPSQMMHDLEGIEAILPWGKTRKEAQNCFQFSRRQPVGGPQLE